MTNGPPISDLLAQAQAALATFDRPRAHQLLTDVIQRDPNNEDAWGLLSNVVADPQDKRQCLERVLAINPHNQSALQGIDQLNREYSAQQVQMQQQAQMQQRPSSRKGLWIALAVILFVGYCALDSMGAAVRTANQSVAAARTHTITYKITGIGTSRASLTINNAQGNTEQHDVVLPWSDTFTARSGHFVYLSAQNQTDSGIITCEILVDGKAFQEASSSSEYGIASCSGSTP